MVFRHLRPALLALTVAACMARPGGPPGPGASPGPGGSRRAQAGPIDTLSLRGHTFFLANDLLAGRGLGTRGADIAALYIESQCRQLGLQAVNGSYTQDVPLVAAAPRTSETSLAIRSGTDSTVFAPADGFLIVGGTEAAAAPFAGPMTFTGTADDIRRAPDSLPVLTGHVAVTLGPVQADVARFLQTRGAIGMVHLVPDEDTYRAYVASRGSVLTLFEDRGIPSSFYPDLPAVLAGPAIVRALVAAIRAGQEPVMALRVTFDRHPVAARNVVCLLPGTDVHAKDTAIAFAAHYDHLGVSLPDEHGDSIYNGFSDDAAGVAMLLAIAQGVRGGPTGGLRHAALFLFFTGEELGFLGSDYFVARPAFPLARIRAVVNLDAGAPPARPWNWQLAGGEGSPLGALAMDVALEHGWSATLSRARPISDFFPFAQQGIPAVLLIPGSAPYEGLSADSSQALFRRWNRYHQASDAYDDAFPIVGLQRYAEFAFFLGLALDGRNRMESSR